MNYKKLIVTKINNIATEIRLNDPDVHNALTLDIINELSLCIDELSRDTSSLILISANGKSFCAGGDLSWMKKQLSAPRENRIKEASKITGFHKESAIGLGGLWRYGDAICPAILFEIKDYAIGISYDMTVSKLLPATNTMGAIEITFRVQTNNKFLYKGYTPR